MLEKEKLLLVNVSGISRLHQKIAELSDERFNMFRICGVNHYENTHSAILSELLRNNSSHSFKNQFLEAFIETLKTEHLLDFEFSFDGVKVTTEKVISDLRRRIDIFIENDRKQCIVIENKIYAADQTNQLKSYKEFAEGYDADKRGHILLYLTLWGTDASAQSGEGVEYKIISYQHTIVKWIEKCVAIAARSPIVRETLIQYINHIKSLTNDTNSKRMNNEIVALLAKDKDNVEAAFNIGSNINNLKNYLVNQVLIHQLQELCKKNGFELQIKGSKIGEKYTGFSVTPPNWKKFKISFEFQNSDYRELIKGVQCQIIEAGEESFDGLKKHFKYSNKNWIWSEFHNEYYNWGKAAMVAIANGDMKNIFMKSITDILEKTKGLEM